MLYHTIRERGKVTSVAFFEGFASVIFWLILFGFSLLRVLRKQFHEAYRTLTRAGEVNIIQHVEHLVPWDRRVPLSWLSVALSRIRLMKPSFERISLTMSSRLLILSDMVMCPPLIFDSEVRMLGLRSRTLFQ